MADYFIRLFSITEHSNLLNLQNAVMQAGLVSEPMGTNQLLIYPADSSDPLGIELTDTNSPVTQADIVELIEWVQASRTSSAESRIFVLNNLTRTVALTALHVPDNMNMELVGWVIDQLLSPQDLMHVADEGFYLDGELIVPLE